jgi:hypothetical protein
MNSLRLVRGLISLLLTAVFAVSLHANTATVPVPRDEKWVARHKGFVELAKAGNVDVLFLGDSITDGWRKGGLAIWEERFAPLKAVNFGIGGDRTQHVLWRIENGELDGISPKVVVLMIGTNNTGFEPDKTTRRNTEAETAEGVRAIVEHLRTKLPSAKILLLAIFPRGEEGLARSRPGQCDQQDDREAEGWKSRCVPQHQQSDFSSRTARFRRTSCPTSFIRMQRVTRSGPMPSRNRWRNCSSSEMPANT